MFYRGLPESTMKDFANKRQVKHNSNSLESSIPFHSLFNITEDIPLLYFNTRFTCTFNFLQIYQILKLNPTVAVLVRIFFCTSLSHSLTRISWQYLSSCN